MDTSVLVPNRASPGPVRTRTEILISGFGGQGVIRIAQILGMMAIRQGDKVTMLKSHGTETRGGYVRAQIVISPTDIDSPVVEAADYFIALSQPAYNRFVDLARGTVLYDPEMVLTIRTDSPVRHVAVPATRVSRDTFSNTLFANVVVLGVLARQAGFDLEALRGTLVSVLPRFHDENLRALDLGFKLDIGSRPE